MAESLYDSLYGQIANMPQGGQGGMPTRKAEKPGLLDYVWGVAAGYNPNDIRRGFESRDQAAAARQAEAARMAEVEQFARSQGPAALAAFTTNPNEYGKATSSGLESYTLASGAGRYGPGGVRQAYAPRVEQTGDVFGIVDPEAANPVSYTAPRPMTIAEGLKQQEQQRQAQQFERTQGLAERQFETNTGIAEAELGIKQADLGTRQTEAQIKAADRAKAEAGQASAQVQTANAMEQALTRSREFINTAGVWTGLQPWKRQGRENLEGNLDTLKSNLTFDKLMEMKASSPVGASGLGALSDNEARLLASTVASLSADMSSQELERSFAEIDRLVAKMRETGGAAGGRSSGPIAVNPTTGARVQWNGSAWVPL